MFFFGVTIHQWPIERHKFQLMDLKDSLKNLCIVYTALAPLRMLGQQRNEASVDKLNFPLYWLGYSRLACGASVVKKLL